MDVSKFDDAYFKSAEKKQKKQSEVRRQLGLLRAGAGRDAAFWRAGGREPRLCSIQS